MRKTKYLVGVSLLSLPFIYANAASITGQINSCVYVPPAGGQQVDCSSSLQSQSISATLSSTTPSYRPPFNIGTAGIIDQCHSINWTYDIQVNSSDSTEGQVMLEIEPTEISPYFWDLFSYSGRKTIDLIPGKTYRLTYSGPCLQQDDFALNFKLIQTTHH